LFSSPGAVFFSDGRISSVAEGARLLAAAQGSIYAQLAFQSLMLQAL